MKANEFVKKFGWDEVIRELNKTQDNVVVMWLGSQSNDYALVKDLKRLVESHELVEKCGGLNSLKAWVKETKSKLSLAAYFHCNKPPVLIQIENAEKAIADVESCMEVS